MILTWHGHACFRLETDEGIIVFDPYEDNSVPGLKPLELSADVILCSHQHSDHNAREVVKQTRKMTHFNINAIDSYHDDKQGSLRGKNIIHSVKVNNMHIVHLGDLGHTLDNPKGLENCDVLMIPVGGHYTINAVEAKEIIDTLKPRIVVPMHYRSETFGYDVISTLDDFLNITDNHIFYDTNAITIDENTPSQIAILKYK